MTKRLVTAVVVGVVVVLVIVWRSAHPPVPASAEPMVEVAAPTHAPVVAASAQPRVVARTMPYAELGEPGLSTDDPLTAYQKLNVYPPTSRPLSADHEDLVHPNQRHERLRPTDAADGVDFMLTADRYFVVGDETITPIVRVERNGKPIAFTVSQAFAAVLDPKATADSPRYPIEVGKPFAPRAVPGLARQTALGLFVELAYAGGAQRARIDFQYTPTAGIPARFTGTFREGVEHGSLVVRAGVDVTRGGRYVVDCNLYDAADRPIAWTRAKLEVDTGAREVELEFFGKVLVDQQARGPLHIGQLRGARFDVGNDPDLEQMPAYPGTFTTRPYEPTDFSDADYDSAHKQQMIRQLTEEQQRGVHRGAAR